MAIIQISGDIISDDDAWIYNWFGIPCTNPSMVRKTIDQAAPDETIEVLINSGGGSVLAGQEIYSILQGDSRVTIQVQSAAYSAAGVIAMAGRCLMSPVSMLMIHNVSMSGASGDYHDMTKNAEILKQMNTAMTQAFVQKTGKSQEEILRLMDRETWLTANQCVEMGFADGLIGDKTEPMLLNSCGKIWLTDERRKQAIREKAEKETKEKVREELTRDLYLFGV